MTPQNEYWFAPVDITVLTDKTLSPIDKAVYGVLCVHADKKTRECWPKVSTIAEEAGCSPRAVHNSLKVLEERGIIQHTQRFAQHRQISSRYQLIGYKAECYRDIPCTTCKGSVHDVQTENESHLNENHKDSLTGGSDSPVYAELPNEPQNDTQGDIPSQPEQEKTPIKPEDIYTPKDAPEAMRSTAEYFTLKTGRKTLTEAEIFALREMNATQYPTRVQKEIDRACELFTRRGQFLDTLTLEYIAASLRNQPTRGHNAKSKQAKRKHDPNALTQAEIDAGQITYTREDLERAKALMRERG
ncbi:MAG: helix-turn-helix domain-containing protein [Synergistaceae bacterium]|nr:helix-turn-helix domain-containing protein [Synergistaceae bacterium]